MKMLAQGGYWLGAAQNFWAAVARGAGVMTGTRSLFNFRYSLLAMLQVALSGGNFLLLYRTFGSGEGSASYLFAQSIVAAVQLLLMMVQEQFIYDYHRMKSNSPVRARLYVSSFLLLSHVLGLFVGAALFFGATPLVRLSAPYMSTAVQDSVAEVLRQLAIVAALLGPTAVLQQTLAARGRIGLGYVLTSIPPLFLFIALTLASRYGLSVKDVTRCLAWGAVACYLAGLALVTPAAPRALAPSMRRAMRTVVASLRVRSALNVQTVYILVGLNHFASTLPVNLVTWLFLAQRGTEILAAVAIGPTQRLLTNRIPRWVHEHRTADVLRASRTVDRMLPIFFVAGAGAAFALLPLARWFNSTPDTEIEFARVCMLLFLAQAVLIWTEMPLALVSLAKHRSDVFFLANGTFVVSSLAFYIVLRHAVPLYSFVISLTISQIGNFYLIRRQGRRELLDSNGT